MTIEGIQEEIREAEVLLEQYRAERKKLKAEQDALENLIDLAASKKREMEAAYTHTMDDFRRRMDAVAPSSRLAALSQERARTALFGENASRSLTELEEVRREADAKYQKLDESIRDLTRKIRCTEDKIASLKSKALQPGGAQ